MTDLSRSADEQIALAEAQTEQCPLDVSDPQVEALVKDVIGRVADKWTMLILELLGERERCGLLV